MRILLALVHYFKAEPNTRYSSTKEELRGERAVAIRSVIDAWRGHCGPVAIKNHAEMRYEFQESGEDTLDNVVLVNGDNHLLDRDYCAARNVRLVNIKLDNPRMLGFGTQLLFADAASSYDMFIYSEDDLKPSDGNFVSRVMAFQEEFGWRRLLLPNRYEWNLNGHALKTLIDGDVPPEWVKPYEEKLPDETVLSQYFPGRTVTYKRAANPHAGIFAITAEQLAHWMKQPHYRDGDCSFLSPLESAATLGVLKTFPIYKSFGSDAGWFEIEHLDNKFSDKDRPKDKGGK
jgi:hypothetical protein